MHVAPSTEAFCIRRCSGGARCGGRRCDNGGECGVGSTLDGVVVRVFLLLREIFVVHWNARHTANKIFLIFWFLYFFSVRHLWRATKVLYRACDEKRTTNALYRAKFSRAAFVVCFWEKRTAKILPCFLPFVVRPKRSAKASFPVVIQCEI
jgi:hypothetical protein